MRTNRGLIAGFEVGHRDVPVPLLIIVGPLVGLLYIILLPFIGLVSFISLGGYRAKQGLATMRHRVTQATVDAPEEARADTVGLRAFIQPLIDELECEFVVVDQKFHIVQYYTPLLHQNKLLEQTAIGKHCFEVSHGRNKPCELRENECPVRKVLETNDKATVTHYHEDHLKGKGRQRLVKALALPIRDSKGSVISVAELIWDADSVKFIALGI